MKFIKKMIPSQNIFQLIASNQSSVLACYNAAYFDYTVIFGKEFIREKFFLTKENYNDFEPIV